MQILMHPDYSEDDSLRGSIRNFLLELTRKDPELFALINEVFNDIRKSGLSRYEKIGYIDRLSYVREPIYELKIPPKKRSQGVARFYFSKSKTKDAIYILTCEKKHGSPKADKSKIKSAEQYYRSLKDG